jgi:hypothetical protein
MEEFRTARTAQQDAAEFFVRIREPFCPALSRIYPALQSPKQFRCKECHKSRMADVPEQARPVVVDIPAPPKNKNLK